MSDTPATDPGGPLKPKLSWRGRLGRILIVGLIACLITAFTFHIDVLGMVGGSLWRTAHPSPSESPVAEKTSTPDSMLQSAVNSITGNARSQPPAPSPTPITAPAGAPGVSGAAGRAGVLTGSAATDLQHADQELANVVPPVDTAQSNAFANLAHTISSSETAQAQGQGQQTQQAPNVPTLVTPTPEKVGPLLTNSGASLLGVTPGQQSGAVPTSMDQMMRATQASFVTNDQDQLAQAYTTAQLTPARSSNEIWPGDPIDCTIKTTINSDLPGQAICIVSRDVKSHLPPYNVLVPATSQMWGQYNALVAQGQTCMQIRWDMLVLPNGATLPLQSVQAEDIDGRAGIPADVNNHVGRVYTTTLIGTLLSVAGGIVTARAATVGTPTVGQLFGVSANNAIQQQAQQRIDAANSAPPTLVVNSGTAIIVSFAAIQPMPSWDTIARSYGPPRT